MTDELQKELVQRLGELTGKPKTSGLHTHPVFNSEREIGHKDDKISIISSALAKNIYGEVYEGYKMLDQQPTGKHEWHTTIAYEQIPSDYCLDRIIELPQTGGGTFTIIFSSICKN